MNIYLRNITKVFASCIKMVQVVSQRRKIRNFEDFDGNTFALSFCCNNT
jgi:hypothetical protein